MIVFVIHVWMM